VIKLTRFELIPVIQPLSQQSLIFSRSLLFSKVSVLDGQQVEFRSPAAKVHAPPDKHN
jgi:hypothetical protein